MCVCVCVCVCVSGAQNEVAVQLIVQHVRDQLQKVSTAYVLLYCAQLVMCCLVLSCV